MSLSKRNTTIVCSVLIAIATCGLSPVSNADIIHESATMGAINQYPGEWLFEDQFLGSRFEITEPTEITAIGGHIGSENDLFIFGTIVTLNDRYDLPSGSPFWGGLKWTWFRPNPQSSDIRTPFEVTLQPGWYGLVFGAGEFGGLSRTAVAFMPRGGQSAYPGSSFFFWNGIMNSWYNDSYSSNPPRFVVEGHPIKPPTEIHGTKFEDSNGNGIWDIDEPAMTGWEFYLDTNGSGSYEIGEPNCVADPNGSYEFIDLDPGTYKVGEVMKDGWTQTFPGGDGFHTLVMDANDIRTGIDFGNCSDCPDTVDQITELFQMTQAWLSKQGEANWNPACDLNNDKWIKLEDFAILAQHWRVATKPE